MIRYYRLSEIGAQPARKLIPFSSSLSGLGCKLSIEGDGSAQTPGVLGRNARCGAQRQYSTIVSEYTRHMPSNTDAPRRHHFFILGLQSQPGRSPTGPTSWRISLEDTYTTERSGFTSVADLAEFLAAWMAQRMDDDQAPLR